MDFSPYWLPLIRGDDCKKIRSTATTADDTVLVKWQLDLCHWLVKQVFRIFPEPDLTTASRIFLPRLDVSCLLNDTALLFASRLLTSGFNRTTLRHWINDINSLVLFTQELQWDSSMVSLFLIRSLSLFFFWASGLFLPSCFAAAVRLTQQKSAVAKMTRRLVARHFRYKPRPVMYNPAYNRHETTCLPDACYWLVGAKVNPAHLFSYFMKLSLPFKVIWLLRFRPSLFSLRLVRSHEAQLTLQARKTQISLCWYITWLCTIMGNNTWTPDLHILGGSRPNCCHKV